MEYLLNPRNMKILESFCLVKTLFAFDYDGTLAPITADPESAFMQKSTSSLLSELNGLSSTAVITGRLIADIKKLLPLNPSFLIGNHGAEGIHSESDLLRMKMDTRHWLQMLKDNIPVLEKLGVQIEDKIFSLSFHYRNAHMPEVTAGALELMLAKFPRSRLSRGKLVVNLLPEDSMNKGQALDHIMKKNDYRFGVYFGDDFTDEDVFKFNNPRLLTIKVGEGPTLAKYFLKSQGEVETVLKLIVDFLRNRA